MTVPELYRKDYNEFIKLIKALFPKDRDTESEGLQVVLFDKNNPEIPYFLINGQLYSLQSLGEIINNMLTKTKVLKRFKLI